MKNNMSHAEQLPQSRSSSSSSSLTSAALELSGNALSILGNTLNELGDAAKQSAGTNTSTSGLNRVVNEHSSQSSQSSPPFPSLPSSALPRDLGLQLSIGGICGFCSGYALKKVGKTAAFVFGIGFFITGLSSYLNFQKQTFLIFIHNSLVNKIAKFKVAIYLNTNIL
jgi:hypothetical protein